ncbi:P-loop containing nucleoside triphosphate hydrolase protein [Panus rudis PR-1116 ss-1]|nr:P-loop containing nucleoside triphosphate hydrolase protein [Panus rudis PR-1116 ss-1]
MRTVKLVVIGASGVGKTSLRNQVCSFYDCTDQELGWRVLCSHEFQYISGRFTTGYRATIGADFITKNVPHYSNPDETVTLQIWDTAGQERFSSLSSAFFRGADAVILMFDVNQPKSLDALTKWWEEFKDKAPVPDDEVDKFCCVIVGNKTDITTSDPPSRITPEQAQQYIDDLIPPKSTPSTPALTAPPIPEVDVSPPSALPSPEEIQESGTRTESIDIATPHARYRRGRKSMSRSQSRSTIWRGGTLGTMTTTHTIYHTPSSSIFDAFESARASPVPASSYSLSRSPSHSPVRSPRRVPSSLSTTSSAPTITPSLFVRGQANTACTTPTPSPVSPLPPQPEHRPKLFFTSAKTGECVSDVFEYIAKRVVMQWEYEEAVEARTLHIQDADDTIRLGSSSNERFAWRKPTCCSS